MDIVMSYHDQLPNTQVMSGVLGTLGIVFLSQGEQILSMPSLPKALEGCSLTTRIALGLLWRCNLHREGLRATGVEA